MGGQRGHCGRADEGAPGASHGLKWLSWMEIGKTGPGPAELERTGIPGRVKGLSVGRREGMTEVGGVGDLAAWRCLGEGASAGWDQGVKSPSGDWGAGSLCSHDLPSTSSS